MPMPLSVADGERCPSTLAQHLDARPTCLRRLSCCSHRVWTRLEHADRQVFNLVDALARGLEVASTHRRNPRVRSATVAQQVTTAAPAPWLPTP